LRIARAEVNGRTQWGEIEGDTFHAIAGDVFAGIRRDGTSVQLDTVRLLSPVDPRRILITMGGFRRANDAPPLPGALPWLLPKIAAPISGDNGEIVVPRSLADSIIWAEVELAIVIGRTVRSASADDAAAAIFGFTCFNDVSAPEFLFDDPRAPKLKPAPDSYRAKSADTFASMGPWIETALTQADVTGGLALTTRVNDVVAAEGSTREHKYALADWVVAASALTTLEPGDVIALGTPQPVEIVAGDSLELEIEGIGVLRNTVVAEPR
jgi:2-keto-4-pentenoate hydratase/2-oxohepta-3-ene-1,7-dioic acid hydratase in catechol pathway